MRLSDVAIDRPVTTIMFLISLMILGGVALFRLPLGFIPQVERPAVSVEVPFNGAHPLEVLREISEPLEDEVALVPGLLRLESESRVGSSRVTAFFSVWDDLDVRRLEVRDAVDRARSKLPDGIGNVEVKSGRGGDENDAVFRGRISADRDLSMDWDLIDQRVKNRMERVQGVAQVNFYGIEAPRVRVELDLDALRRHGVSAAQVSQAISTANSGLALGVIRGPQLRFDVRDDSRPSSAAEIAGLPLLGTSLRVSDVAKVTYKPPRLDYARTLNRRPAIGFDCYKDAQANTVEVVDGLRREIAAMNDDPHLQGLTVQVWADQAEEIKLSLQGLLKTGLFGGSLALVILFLFLRRISLTAVLAVAIPFSLIATCGMLYVLGFELNVLTLLGLMIGVGMLVDNAVVVVENIHRLELKGIPPRDAARRGAGNVALAVTAATATTVLVWSWLPFIEPGELKTYLGQVALTMSLAVACSLVVSLTFVPMVAARYLPAAEAKPSFFERRLVPAYGKLLGFTLRHRAATLGVLIVLALSSIYPLQSLEFADDINELPRWVPVSYQFREPQTLERLRAVVDQVEATLEPHAAELGIQNIYSWMTEQGGYAMTFLFIPRELAFEDSIKEIRAKLEPLLPEIPGVTISAQEREWWRRMRGPGNAGERRVMVTFRGNEPETLGLVVSDVRKRLEETLTDAKSVFAPERGGRQEARLLVDPDRVRQAGSSPRDVANTVTNAFRGRLLTQMRTEQGERDVFVTVPDSEELGFADLEALPVTIEDGSVVSLGSIVQLETALTPETIRREGQRVSSWLMVTFPETLPSGRQLTTDDAQQLVSDQIAMLALPNGVTWDFGEWGRFRTTTMSTMWKGTLLSLLIVVLLMAAMFESLTQPLAIVVTLPLGFFGGLWALYFDGSDLDPVAFIGVVILIGIVVNNGIVLVDHINLLRRRGEDRQTALLRGCGDRLRPVLMTAITTVVGLAPLALSQSAVARISISSMALVVMGGLATSTVFTLLALPVWYTVLEDVGEALRESVRVPVAAMTDLFRSSARPRLGS